MPNVLFRSIEVELPESQIDSAIAKKLSSLDVKGFRKGSLPPLSYLRKKWGDDFLTEILQDLLQIRINSVIAEMHADLASGIQVEALWHVWDQPLRYKYLIQFEIFPTFTVLGLDEITLPPARSDVIDDAQIDTFVEIARRERSQWKNLDRAARAGDRIVVNFNGTIDGIGFPGGHGQAVKLDLGAGGMLPEFEAALTGAVPDQNLSFSVTFPESYVTPFLAGKTAAFQITVLAVQAIELLPMADLAVRYGETSVESMRESFRKKLIQNHREQDQRDISNHLLDQLVRKNDIPLPEALVSQHLQGMKIEIARMQGRSVEQVEVDEGMMHAARRRAHMGVVVRQILKTESLDVSQADIEARLSSMATDERMSAEILKNPEVIHQVTIELMQERVIDWLIERARKNSDTAAS
jgi:trigger factor